MQLSMRLLITVINNFCQKQYLNSFIFNAYLFAPYEETANDDCAPDNFY